jgi:hypothetical protein
MALRRRNLTLIGTARLPRAHGFTRIRCHVAHPDVKHGCNRDVAAAPERLVRVVECRYFAGLTIPETAEALGISHMTLSED